VVFRRALVEDWSSWKKTAGNPSSRCCSMRRRTRRRTPSSRWRRKVLRSELRSSRVGFCQASANYSMRTVVAQLSAIGDESYIDPRHSCPWLGAPAARVPALRHRPRQVFRQLIEYEGYSAISGSLSPAGTHASRRKSTGAACFAPYMKRMMGPNTGELATPTMKSPGTDDSNPESSAGMPCASRAMSCRKAGSR
jgi:hypothetical protein